MDRPWPTATSTSALGSTLPICSGRCSLLGPLTTPLPCPVGPVVTLHAVFQEVSLRVALRTGVRGRAGTLFLCFCPTQGKAPWRHSHIHDAQGLSLLWPGVLSGGGGETRGVAHLLEEMIAR